MKHVKHVKYILHADRYIKQIPNYSTFGRKTTLRINPDEILDLHWSLADTYYTTNIGLTYSNVKVQFGVKVQGVKVQIVWTPVKL